MKPCRYVAAGVVLVGAGVITVTPITAALPDLHVPDIQLTAGAEDIVIDIVRHAEDLAPANMRIPFSPEFPGAPLSDLGQHQAQDTADRLFDELGGPHGVAGIFSGPDLDAQGTAAPFATLQDMAPQILPGLVEGVPEPLPNAAVVEIQGNPEDGWTLVSWAGQPVPENPGLLTDLFTLWRDLILPPQTATYHIFEALLTGDPTTIGDAVQDGLQGVGAAVAQVPQLAINVIDDIVTANW